MVNFKTWCTTRSCNKVSSSPFSPGRKYQKICSVLTFTFLIYLIVSGIVSAPAGAAYMFASDTGDGYLKRINQTTGAATNVGPIGSSEVRGLSASPYPNIVYGAETSGQKLWTINVGTGAGSSVRGVFGYDIRELAYDPVNDVLYGTDFSKLYTVDQSSGAAAPVGAFGSDIVFAWALDYDTATSRIYGVDAALDQLFWADPSTGGATLIGGFTGHYNITDIAFDRETGKLYGIERGESPDYFFTIDKTSGATTNIGSMGEPINVLGLAKPIPEPAPLFLLGSGLLGLVWLVRKKAGRC